MACCMLSKIQVIFSKIQAIFSKIQVIFSVKLIRQLGLYTHLPTDVLSQ